MKKTTLFTFFATTLLLLATVSCKEEILNLTPESSAWEAQTRAEIDGLNRKSMKVLSSTESSLEMELNITNYAKKAVSIGEKEYFSISAPEAHSLFQKGNPSLPEYSYSIVIPATAACNVSVVDAEYEDISLQVAPSKGSEINPTDPYTFSEVYEKDAFFPAKLATADAPFLMRDVRGSVVRLHPFQYNPVTGILRVYKKMKVEVSFSGTDDRNVPSGIRHTIDQSMEELFRDMFINYDVMTASNGFPDILGEEMGDKGAPPGPDDPPLPPVPSEKMLIICCDSFATDVSTFIYHKNSIMGITTRLVTMSNVGTTAGDIFNYIQYDYSVNKKLTYVLLVGDYERVPTYSVPDGGSYSSEYGAADPWYGRVYGTDSIPDIYVGRFSARTHSEVETMVARTLYYENHMSPIPTWRYKSIGMCDDYYNYNPDHNPNHYYLNLILEMLDYSNYSMESLRGLYRTNNFNCGYANAHPAYCPTTAATCDTINSGAFIIDYIGGGGWNKWDFDLWGDIPGTLQNDNKLPFVYSASPGVGDFINSHHINSDPCFAERWLTACNSVTGAATGAIGFYGSSISSFNYELISAALNFNSSLTTITSSTRNFGVLCYNSAITMRNQFGSAADYILLKWNYFGDPSLAVIPNEYVLEK